VRPAPRRFVIEVPFAPLEHYRLPLDPIAHALASDCPGRDRDGLGSDPMGGYGRFSRRADPWPSRILALWTPDSGPDPIRSTRRRRASEGGCDTLRAVPGPPRTPRRQRPERRWWSLPPTGSSTDGDDDGWRVVRGPSIGRRSVIRTENHSSPDSNLLDELTSLPAIAGSKYVRGASGERRRSRDRSPAAVVEDRARSRSESPIRRSMSSSGSRSASFTS
jgi:hypothetical protein